MPYKKYSIENLNNALEQVKNDEISAYKASKLYKVPYQSLLDKIKNTHTNPSGHATVLTKEEEDLFVKWVHHMAKIGFPVTKEQLRHSVSKLDKELNRPNPFKDGIPGRHWYEAFLKRNPDVSSRVCINKNKDAGSENNKTKKTKSKKTCHSEATQSLDAENITGDIKENKIPTKKISLKIGDYVVVAYEGENFPGLISKVSEGTPKPYDVKTMTMGGLNRRINRVNWRWPEKDDILTYNYEDVIKKIKAPIPLIKRGVYSVVDM